MSPIKSKFSDNRLVKAMTPLAAALLLVVCISGVFIYPFLFSAAGVGTGTVSDLASKLLITALVAQIGALIPALITSFTRERYSITLTLVLSLTAAVFFSWLSMLFQQISPLGGIGGFSGGVLNVMFTALIGSVLSVVPALVATFVSIARRVIARLINDRKQ